MNRYKQIALTMAILLLPATAVNADGEWIHAGQCFALLEGIRQSTTEPGFKKDLEPAVKRASLNFIRHTARVGKSIDTSSPEGSQKDMRDYLVLFDTYNRKLSEKGLSDLYDTCMTEFF